MWKNTDPRHDVDYCNRSYAEIVIIRPIAVFGGKSPGISFGYVYTEHGWSIHTSFEDHKYISANDSWDDAWYWTYAP